MAEVGSQKWMEEAPREEVEAYLAQRRNEERLLLVSGSYGTEVAEGMEERAEQDRLRQMAELRDEMDDAGFSVTSLTLTWVASVCHRTAKANGFWTHYPAIVGNSELGLLFQRMYLATKIALIHEEGSEILRCLRRDEGTSRLHEELADTIIRCLDMAHLVGGDFGQVLLDKMKENTERPYRHGRAF